MPETPTSDETITGKDLTKALAPVAIALGLKLLLMAGIRRAARNAIAEREATQ